jgi:hypothetical protein
MFDKVSRLAEHVATGLSRRAFLGRFVAPLALATFVGQLAAQGRSSCIYLGSCCGGQYPYYDALRGGCTYDRHCRFSFTCVPSPRCCGGTGRCLAPTGTCYADQYCGTVC